ncbi:MAG: hypothetical protein RLY83_114 [Actinomycetota bacterium]|jgi:uncharacterized protein (DUF305 family)
MKLRRLAIASTLALVGFALSGCTVNINTNDGHHMMGGNNSSFSNTDVMFAQMMIPHHQQAVDMGTLAGTHASNAAVKALAAQIGDEQAPEIAQMKGWLKDAGAGMEMGYDMSMGGMLSDSEFEALKTATGAAFDKLYLQGMIGHHEGAIQMAKMVLNSKNAEVKALGEAIVASQTKQITYMKELLTKLG